MVRNSTRGPQSWWHNGHRVNEKVINVWDGTDDFSAAVLPLFLLYVWVTMSFIKSRAKNTKEGHKCKYFYKALQDRHLIQTYHFCSILVK